MVDSSPKNKEVYTFDFALKVLTAVNIYLVVFTYLFNLIPQHDNPFLSRILYDERVAEFNAVYVFLLLLDSLALSYFIYIATNFLKRVDWKNFSLGGLIKKIKIIRLKRIDKRIDKRIVKFFRKFKIFCSIILKDKLKHHNFYVEYKRDISNFGKVISFISISISLVTGTFLYPKFGVISSLLGMLVLLLLSDRFDIGAKFLFSSFLLSTVFFVSFIPETSSCKITEHWRVHTTEDDEFKEFDLTSSKIAKNYMLVTINGTTKILPLSSITSITLSEAKNKSSNEKKTKGKVE